jgi:hypothetical protein
MKQNTRAWTAASLIVAALLGAATASAQPVAAPTASAAAVADAPRPAAPAQPVQHDASALEPPVTTVERVVALHTSEGETGRAQGGLNDVLLIEMRQGDVAKLERHAAAKGRALAIFFDGQLLRGLTPYVISPTDKDVLRVALVRTDENRAVWGSLLGGRFLKPRRVLVRVGLDDGVPLSRPSVFSLVPMPHRGGIAIIGLALALVLSLVVAGRRTTMLRDGLTPEGQLGTFSLARTQAALWFAHIVIAFLWIWAITGEADTITESSLALLGIGSGTALGGALIDKDRGAAGPAPVLPSRGFLDDLLTDENGYALHRFQMLVWSIVLFILFWSSVYRHLAMPQFDATVLGLMGISSGTYLGFKLPEKRAPSGP